MLFRNARTPILAISQPAHAWISGQLLRAWATPLDEHLLLAAEQHDIGWLDWETVPTFDLATGRPHLFRDVGAATHAPMWARGVDRACAAWGRRVALLVSRHGTTIYTRFTTRHHLGADDTAAIHHYLQTQGALQAEWTRALALDQATLDHDTDLIALSDTLSLALCGELDVPLVLDAPILDAPILDAPILDAPILDAPILDAPVPEALGRVGAMAGLTVGRRGEDFTLAPWPLRPPTLTVEAEARALPSAGRFPDAAAMQAWHAAAATIPLRIRLIPG